MKRYTPSTNAGGENVPAHMCEDPNGGWVRWEDVQSDNLSVEYLPCTCGYLQVRNERDRARSVAKRLLAYAYHEMKCMAKLGGAAMCSCGLAELEREL